MPVVGQSIIDCYPDETNEFLEFVFNVCGAVPAGIVPKVLQSTPALCFLQKNDGNSHLNYAFANALHVAMPNSWPSAEDALKVMPFRVSSP